MSLLHKINFHFLMFLLLFSGISGCASDGETRSGFKPPLPPNYKPQRKMPPQPQRYPQSQLKPPTKSYSNSSQRANCYYSSSKRRTICPPKKSSSNSSQRANCYYSSSKKRTICPPKKNYSR